MDTKNVDKEFRELARRTHGWLGFEIRDRIGIAPYKIRTTMIITDGDGSHFVEVESIFDDSDGQLEKSYQEAVKELVMREAKDIIKGD